MQGKKQRERYRRLDRAERAAIQSGLDKGRSCRQMARELGRSPSTVADEVARNRTVSKGPGKGERVRDAPEDACPKLLSWPRCCNGCRNLRYRSCSRRWRCEYSAARAQALADAELRESRIGVDRDEAGFEDEGGHKDMWFAARDIAFEHPVDEAERERSGRGARAPPVDGGEDPVAEVFERAFDEDGVADDQGV